MRGARGVAIALAAVLLLSLAVPAWAQHDQEGRRVELTGVIVAIDTHERSFVLRVERRREDRLWVVQVRPQTRIEFGRLQGADDDDDDDEGRLAAAHGLRPLRVGYIVEVEGRVTDDRRLVAREITVIGRVRRLPPFPGSGRPPFGFPGQAPQIFFPQDGSALTTRDFVVVGRTVPRAQVHVTVTNSWGFFHFVVGSADVTADGSGIFVATIRPSTRPARGTYQINVQARAGGFTLPPAHVAVHLR